MIAKLIHCEACNKLFVRAGEYGLITQRFCSQNCRQKAYRQRKARRPRRSATQREDNGAEGANTNGATR
jgi:hypothetical protein